VNNAAKIHTSQSLATVARGVGCEETRMCYFLSPDAKYSYRLR